MLCRYFAIQLILGAAVALALAEIMWPDAGQESRECQPHEKKLSGIVEANLALGRVECRIPEMYLRPELIPVKSDGLPTVAEAERVVRAVP